jgi:antitoxin component of MazEF toxin-antitoxin module
MTVTVKQIGGSMAVVIPKRFAEDMGLAPGIPLEISQRDDAILLRKSRQRVRRPISQIVAEIDPKAYARRAKHDLDNADLGREIR